MVDALDLGSSTVRCKSSSLFVRISAILNRYLTAKLNSFECAVWTGIHRSPPRMLTWLGNGIELDLSCRNRGLSSRVTHDIVQVLIGPVLFSFRQETMDAWGFATTSYCLTRSNSGLAYSCGWGVRLGVILSLSAALFGLSPRLATAQIPLDTDNNPGESQPAIIDSDPDEIPTPNSSPIQPRSGFLRVGNRTPYPVRIVVLLRGGEHLINPKPAHWDFAPGEGGTEGLMLSLGEEAEPLQISPGDVIVAFTIDGTRRYWGPNVAGESLAPFWDPQNESWSMILQP